MAQKRANGGVSVAGKFFWPGPANIKIKAGKPKDINFMKCSGNGFVWIDLLV